MTSLRKSLTAMRIGQRVPIRNYKESYVRKIVSIMNSERSKNADYVYCTDVLVDGEIVIHRASTRLVISVNLSEVAYAAATAYAKQHWVPIDKAVDALIVAGLRSAAKARSG